MEVFSNLRVFRVLSTKVRLIFLAQVSWQSFADSGTHKIIT